VLYKRRDSHQRHPVLRLSTRNLLCSSSLLLLINQSKMFNQLLLLALFFAVGFCEKATFGDVQVEQETVLVPVVVSEKF
jgi:hypothetical protein